MRNDELIERAKAGAPGAFDQLYFAYVDRVHRQLTSILGDDPDFDDVLQHTFLQVFRKLEGFRGDAAFSTWLHRITLNSALEHLRKRNRRGGREIASPDIDRESPEEALEDRLERKEALTALYAILEGLKPKKRVVFVLYEVEGHTLEEIARSMDESINTIAGRLRSARKDVRKSMRAQRAATRGITVVRGMK